MSNELETFVKRLVDQGTIMAETGGLLVMLHERDQARNVQTAEIKAVERGRHEEKRAEFSRTLKSAHSAGF